MGELMSKGKRSPAEVSLNQRYGSLIVVEIVSQTNFRGEKFARCICDCGGEKIAQLALIRRGSIASCGCAKRISSLKNVEKAHEHCITQGLWKEPKLRSAQSVYQKYSDGDISFDEFMVLSQMDCFYCGATPSNRTSVYGKNNGITQQRIDNSYFVYNGLDRVDSSIGHTKNNVVPCCADCNYAKLERTQDEFFSWIKRVYDKCLH